MACTDVQSQQSMITTKPLFLIVLKNSNKFTLSRWTSLIPEPMESLDVTPDPQSLVQDLCPSPDIGYIPHFASFPISSVPSLLPLTLMLQKVQVTQSQDAELFLFELAKFRWLIPAQPHK